MGLCFEFLNNKLISRQSNSSNMAMDINIASGQLYDNLALKNLYSIYSLLLFIMPFIKVLF